jgi:hypothetical protein
MISSRRSFLKEFRNLPEKLNLRKKIRKIPEDPDVLNAPDLGIFGLIAGILKRARGSIQCDSQR